MFRLAHISDLHLHPLPDVRWHQLANKRLTGYLNWKFNRKDKSSNSAFAELITHLLSAGPDHVAITGDLVNLALPEEISRARTFLDQFFSPENCSVIGGNHDAYVPGSFKNCLKAWHPFMTGDSQAKPELQEFPYLRVRGNVAIIACNSAEATLPFMATGYFREQQAMRLSRILKETQGMFRVVLIHHPPLHDATKRHKRLIGTDRFQQTIATHGAELVLHGHTHLATSREIDGTEGKKVPVICVPAAGSSFGGHRPAGRYNLFEIEKKGNGWSVVWQAYGKKQPASAVELIEERLL